MISFEDLTRKVVSEDEIMYQADGKDYLSIRRCRDDIYPKAADDAWTEYIGETNIALRGGGLMFILFQDFLSDNEKAKNFLIRNVERHERAKKYFETHPQSPKILALIA